MVIMLMIIMMVVVVMMDDDNYDDVDHHNGVDNYDYDNYDDENGDRDDDDDVGDGVVLMTVCVTAIKMHTIHKLHSTHVIVFVLKVVIQKLKIFYHYAIFPHQDVTMEDILRENFYTGYIVICKSSSLTISIFLSLFTS